MNALVQAQNSRKFHAFSSTRIIVIPVPVCNVPKNFKMELKIWITLYPKNPQEIPIRRRIAFGCGTLEIKEGKRLVGCQKT